MRPLTGFLLLLAATHSAFIFAQTDTTRPKNEVEITGDKKGVISGKDIQKSEILTETEFKKAACCTLSESFETTNTLEVSNADGVSGIRQIEMLGLAGKYVQMSQLNMPVVRGLSVLTGLSHIPGPMVSAVHLSKGTGSVTEGFEGLTGGINYALKQDPTEPKLFLNAYLNNQWRGEVNLISKQRINHRTFNHSFLHYGGQWKTMDFGGDGFTDMPLSNRVFVGNQVSRYNDKNEWIIGFSHVSDERRGGNLHHFMHKEPEHDVFHFNMIEQKTDVWGKFGIFLNKEATRSIGQILHVNRQLTHALLNSLRGRHYEGKQLSLYYSAIYATPESKPISTRSGLSVMFDNINESLSDSGALVFNPTRKEMNFGTFSEWVFKAGQSSLVLGLRSDYNNLFGWLITPRIHAKWEIDEKGKMLHFQSGRGVRTPWLLAENLPLFISNRIISIKDYRNGGAYGQQREDAINTGFSLTLPFRMFGYPAKFITDAFHNLFLYMIGADRDQRPDLIAIGKIDQSRYNAIQTDLQLQPHRRVELRLSYRYIENQLWLGGNMRQQPLLSKHRFVGVVSIKNRKKWHMDAIFQWNSPKRLPETSSLPEQNQMLPWSPSYTIVNLQLSKDISKKWEWYAGGENLLNIVQENPVLSAENPQQPWFDAAYAWGPVIGINAYMGFRLKIK
ncbi:MAG: TonB-dependent receptor [Sphingomonadales bacterium]|nr:TonB-dependent receptor [Sphingomonadales bacterium]